MGTEDKHKKKDKKSKSKKSKKEKRDKKESRDKDRKKRRRDDSSTDSSSSDTSSSDSDAEQQRKKHKSAKLASKVAQHMQKGAAGGEVFVWTKKIEKELGAGKKLQELSAMWDRDRHQERLDELEKVRKRQAEREAEKARREEELSMLQRTRAAAEAMESEAKEEEFYLKSAIEKAERRLAEGRGRPIDLIAKNLHLTDQYEPDLRPPWVFCEGKLLEDVQELAEGVKEFLEYDRYDESHVEFWNALKVIVDHELREALKRDEVDRAVLRGGQAAAAAAAGSGGATDRGLHSSLQDDIEAMLTGQTYSELQALERSVEASLRNGEGDPEYWEAVLQRLVIHKAKARVRELQASIFQQSLAKRMAASDKQIEDAMGWAEEDRGVVRAAGAGSRSPSPEPRRPSDEYDGMPPPPPRAPAAAVVGKPPKNAEEIDLEEDEDMEGGPGAAPRPAGAAGPSGEGAAAAAGPETEGEAVPLPYLVPRRWAAPGEDEANEADVAEEAALADGRFSPPPIDPKEAVGHEVISEEDDYRELELLRQLARQQAAERFRHGIKLSRQQGGSSDISYHDLRRRGGGVHPMLRNLCDSREGEIGYRSGRLDPSMLDDEERQFRAAASKAMGQDEGDRDFTGEIATESKVYWWHDKYKPRRPKYFNRVHTGYEWNKYNQTHYDSDNPPPKVVQGYKFNILYHDLIDKSQAPTYKVEPDPQSKDGTTAIIRFSAGPPYEDIAFRVVNKEWEYSHKRGFKSTFERGILHLFFNFKRARYRR